MRTVKCSLLVFTFLAVSATYSKSQSYSLLNNDDIVKVQEMFKSNVRDVVRIPNFGGYSTMKCDFHTHTVFSDGDVWPSSRVKEAWQNGLDAIAITDHIEYRPHKEILKSDHNESYKIARKQGEDMGLIVIKGSEITRSKPLGHLNALFLTDANPLDTAEPLDAIDAALKQGAFIMWNHPGWPDNLSTLYPVHEELLKNGKIHGVEVFNSAEYYPVAFDWCAKYSVAFMGNSDVHGMINGEYSNSLRPMTLVFAAERSEKGIKDALFARRTAAYFDGYLAGKPEHLLGLLEASLQIKIINAEKRKIEVTNISDISYKINCGDKNYVFPAGKTVAITVPTEGKATVLNCFVGKNTFLTFDAGDIRL